MKLRKTAGVYAIVVGAGIFGLWLMLLVTGQVPELATAPAEIGLHLAAEGIIAGLLVAAGIGLLRAERWGFRMFLVATGGLLYSIVNSSGYYVQRDNPAMIIMFAVLLVLTVVSVILSLHRQRQSA